MRHLIQQLQLLYTDLVNLVDHIDAWHVHSVAFNHIDQVIDGGVASEMQVSIRDLIFMADGSYNVIRKLSHFKTLALHNTDPTFIFSLD